MRVKCGDDIFHLFVPFKIGTGEPKLIVNSDGIAKPRDDGGIVFMPVVFRTDCDQFYLDMAGCDGWWLPGITMTHLADGTKIGKGVVIDA